MQTIIKRLSRKRLVILFVCAFVVLGGIVTWTAVGGDGGPPACAKTKVVNGRKDLGGAIDCAAKVAKWCHEHHPGDTAPCTNAVAADGDDRNIDKYKNAARDAKPVPPATSTMRPLQQAFEKNRKALYDWYEMGLDPLKIKITKMELKPDDYVYITVNLASGDGHDKGLDAGLDSFNSYHQDDFETTLKHMTELKGIKGIKTFYSDDKPIHAPGPANQ
ncbi:hypothetical protein OIB37_33820 [Streptomyces sp. NBC_00820]|uniref:hypothetical protein n=1 Tax=Streptomyces sp. NBC_00820 TaxID=2975842 RepID=UPI002ED23FAE|nr:hypothetical protein OIB37_33820 [Streptomyces sp. NBC_00820]